jgi:hypothetical protein
MWKSDPFKAKWTIIAKADSTIRDAVGKQRTSLLVFLTLVCPKIGIINTEDYLWKMNWALQGTGAGTQVLKQTFLPDLSNFSTDILYTNMTAKDIIRVCAQVGYITQNDVQQIGREFSSARWGPHQEIRYLSRA